MTLAEVFHAHAPSFYLSDVADHIFKALPKNMAGPWHWQDLIDLRDRSIVDLRPIDFYDEYLAKRITKAVEGEGLVTGKPYELRMPPGVKGALEKRDDWAVRLILDYNINRDSQVLKIDIARA